MRFEIVNQTSGGPQASPQAWRSPRILASVAPIFARIWDLSACFGTSARKTLAPYSAPLPKSPPKSWHSHATRPRLHRLPFDSALGEHSSVVERRRGGPPRCGTWPIRTDSRCSGGLLRCFATATHHACVSAAWKWDHIPPTTAAWDRPRFSAMGGGGGGACDHAARFHSDRSTVMPARMRATAFGRRALTHRRVGNALERERNQPAVRTPALPLPRIGSPARIGVGRLRPLRADFSPDTSDRSRAPKPTCPQTVASFALMFANLSLAGRSRSELSSAPRPGFGGALPCGPPVGSSAKHRRRLRQASSKCEP